ncbi:hypothetical protein CAOG_009585 [Capsaspora owczarzaki ATCC 30864]|uniref:Uncharacterized protein n=1 Tax=Capsaspora owczarzaki (strain ATCC 30864) TaxID=595528 RepID=A0A0D2U9F9_CAPO3|nr:hypothetical protein CAOG_009585 [Capsaspora owczarzaki ATCC 30864]
MTYSGDIRVGVAGTSVLIWLCFWQDNFDYPLVDLQVATTAIKAHMINRLERPGKSTDRLRFPSLLASTLPGAGKSRLCQEFVGSIAPDVFNSRRLEFISLFVTFNNATNFDSIKDWTIVHNADPEHALATRLLQAYFDIPPTFFELNFAQTGSFQVAATLKFIQQFEFKRRRGRAPKPGDQLPYVAIAVDEINRLLAVSADALKEPAAVKRADAASNADEQDKVGAQEKLVSEANPVPQVLSASEASVVQANLARQRYLEKVKSQRWLLKQTLWSLKAATIDPASRLFVLYAGTLPEHLRPGLVEPLDSNASGSSNLAVNPVPMEPFDGPHTAEFVDVVAGVKQTKLDWRLDATLVGQLRIAGGLPRHIEDVMDVDTPDAIARPQLSPISLIKLVRFCAFNARLTGKPLLEDVAAWVSRGAAVAAEIGDTEHSFELQHFAVPADQVLEPVRHSLELIEQLAGSLKQCLNSITADMQGSASRPDLWERLVVHLFNLRVTAYLADHVLSSLAPSSSIRVPLTELLPGVKFGPGCSELSLKLNPKTLKNFSFMQLADRGEPGIDAYMHADLVGHRSKTRVVIGLQMKLHMQLKSMTPTKYEKAARKQLEKHYVDEQHRQNTLVLVGIMSTSRRATTDPPKHSWVLERDTLDEFAQGFQKVVQCAYSFDPHHSPATHIASFLYSWGTKSQAVCDALAHLLVQTRHRVHQPDSRQQFRTAEDLRQFLLAQIGASKEVSFTLTESGKTKQVAHTLTKKDVPLVKHLGWYFALPRKARSATSSSSASVSS